MIRRNKRGALELSIGTIVIIVIAMTMLILGIVFVRSVMCGAIGLTSLTNAKVEGEIKKIFEATGNDVACIGGGGEAAILTPGKQNIIYCSIKAKKTAEFKIQVRPGTADEGGGFQGGAILQGKDIKEWVVGTTTLEKRVSPGDESPQKFLKLNVPENAPEDSIRISIEVYEDDVLIASPDLDFDVKRLGMIKSAIC